MARGMRRGAPLRRKPHFLRPISASKLVRESSIVSVLLLCIHKLNLKLAALTRDYCNLHATSRQLLKQAGLLKNEVSVKKVGNTAQQSYVVRVSCERNGGTLVSILEAFEKMGLDVLQTRVSCNRRFAMEAIAVAAAAQARPLEAKDVTQALLKAIEQEEEEEEEEEEVGGGNK